MKAPYILTIFKRRMALRRVARVRPDVSEERSASFIRVTRIGELGTTLPVTTNARYEEIPGSVTSQKTPFVIVTAVKTSNLTLLSMFLTSN
jgi:hypothetical protein